uniref:Uncharacterized protein n=1 Tax=Rhizophora mucronata TaxID=61149 RepID=A0A2P2NVC4_RHIMU
MGQTIFLRLVAGISWYFLVECNIFPLLTKLRCFVSSGSHTLS